MKRRFNCVAGKVQRASRSIESGAERSRTKVSQPEGSGREGAQPKRARPEPVHVQQQPPRRQHSKLPQSPWDPRLRHPWVWAYRRVHGRRVAAGRR